MDMSDAVASACAAMPFSRAEGPPPKSPQEVDLEALPLETFAALSAALARGESREGVLAKHGLTASAFDAIAAAWGRRLQREPNMLARFNELATRAVKPAPATLMLSLEQHASLHVELAQHPARKDAILQRYNITPEQQAVVDEDWRDRMTRDPALREAWHHAHAAYAAWFSQTQKA
jgi:hypothetical protein